MASMFLGSIVLNCILPTSHCQCRLRVVFLNLRVRCSCVYPVESRTSVKNFSSVCALACRSAWRRRSMPKGHLVAMTGKDSHPICAANASSCFGCVNFQDLSDILCLLLTFLRARFSRYRCTRKTKNATTTMVFLTLTVSCNV